MFIGENTALISSHLTQVGNMRVSQHRYAGAPFSSLLLFWHGSPSHTRDCLHMRGHPSLMDPWKPGYCRAS
jgi:hypothetical protein